MRVESRRIILNQVKHYQSTQRDEYLLLDRLTKDPILPSKIESFYCLIQKYSEQTGKPFLR